MSHQRKGVHLVEELAPGCASAHAIPAAPVARDVPDVRQDAPATATQPVLMRVHPVVRKNLHLPAPGVPEVVPLAEEVAAVVVMAVTDVAVVLPDVPEVVVGARELRPHRAELHAADRVPTSVRGAPDVMETVLVDVGEAAHRRVQAHVEERVLSLLPVEAVTEIVLLTVAQHVSAVLLDAADAAVAPEDVKAYAQEVVTMLVPDVLGVADVLPHVQITVRPALHALDAALLAAPDVVAAEATAPENARVVTAVLDALHPVNQTVVRVLPVADVQVPALPDVPDHAEPDVRMVALLIANLPAQRHVRQRACLRAKINALVLAKVPSKNFCKLAKNFGQR